MKIVFLVNVDWFFLSHRVPVAMAAREMGYDVYVVTGDSGRAKEITDLGFKFYPIPLERAGLHPVKELASFLSILRIYRKIKPDLVHQVTIKPIIYGSLAARFTKIRRIISMVSGLGYNFSPQAHGGARIRAFLLIYKLAVRSKKNKVIFQNPDNMDYFIQHRVIKRDQAVLIKGSGVDMNEFKYTPPAGGVVKFLFAARLLIDKGIREYLRMAEIMKVKYPSQAEFIVAGIIDPESPTMISEEELLGAHNSGSIKWIGFKKDMKELLGSIDVMVLPSYGEGVPKVLIEAAAVGRPIIATDTPGCREIVIDNKNGFLVPVKDAETLAQAAEKLIRDERLRLVMGRESRKLAEAEFSLDKVIEQTTELYRL